MTITASTERILVMLEGIRRYRLKQFAALTETQAMQIPVGLRNNVHWHIGHLLHVQLAHWYVRRGLPLPEQAQTIDFKRYFRDGKSPADYDDKIPTYAALLNLFRDYSEDLARKYGAFLEAPMTQGFEYMGMPFQSIADDLYLLVYHEGEHGPMIDRIYRYLGIQF